METILENGQAGSCNGGTDKRIKKKQRKIFKGHLGVALSDHPDPGEKRAS